jgi:hypothetical protein
MKLFKTMLLEGMGNVKKVKLVDPFQTPINSIPGAVTFHINFAFSINNSPQVGLDIS